MAWVEHPRIRPGTLEDRLYQQRIASTAIERNTLAVLPTGLGKTAIALRVAAEALLRAPTRSILLLAPTRPLVVQHGTSLGATLLAPPPVVLTGTISPERRAALLAPPRVIVATPQVVANDLASGSFPLESLSLIVFDEAHRAVGHYPYVEIARRNREAADARVLAMTASPGASLATIRSVWSNLGIAHVEHRTGLDPDVAPYVHAVGIEAIELPLPFEVQRLAVGLRATVARQVQRLAELDLLAPGASSKRELLAVGEALRRQIQGQRARGEPTPPLTWAAVTAQAAAMKGLHALELVETQGVESLRAFLARQDALKGTPAIRAFLGDPDVEQARRSLDGLALEHPKVERAVELVVEQLTRSPESRVIVFTQYRQTAEMLASALAERHEPAVRAARFVGQSSREADEGMSQKEQVELLGRFRSGELNCLVATSVAEEGLDVPSTDLVIFYEPVPDVIRSIQRRGRTGRVRTGRAIVLVAQGTRDVGLFRGLRRREFRMHEMLDRVEEEAQRGGLKAAGPRLVQRSIDEFPSGGGTSG